MAVVLLLAGVLITGPVNTARYDTVCILTSLFVIFSFIFETSEVSALLINKSVTSYLLIMW